MWSISNSIVTEGWILAFFIHIHYYIDRGIIQYYFNLIILLLAINSWQLILLIFFFFSFISPPHFLQSLFLSSISRSSHKFQLKVTVKKVYANCDAHKNAKRWEFPSFTWFFLIKFSLLYFYSTYSNFCFYCSFSSTFFLWVYEFHIHSVIHPSIHPQCLCVHRISTYIHAAVWTVKFCRS